MCNKENKETVRLPLFIRQKTIKVKQNKCWSSLRVSAFIFIPFVFLLQTKSHLRVVQQDLFPFRCSREMQKNSHRFVKIILKKNDNFDLTLQKRRFCTPKEPLLPCKSGSFTMRNNRFWNVLVMRWLRNISVVEKYLHFYGLLSAHKTWSRPVSKVDENRRWCICIIGLHKGGIARLIHTDKIEKGGVSLFETPPFYFLKSSTNLNNLLSNNN